MERPRDVVGGLLVVALGAGFLLVGRELEFGTARNMGPGYFPTVLAGLLVLLGAVLAGLGGRAARAEGAFGHVPWRGVLLIVGAVAFFGLGLRGLGLLPVLLLVVLATAWASRYASLRASVPLALGIAAFCTLLFIRLLGLPLPMVGPWLSPAWWSPPPAATAPAPEAAPAAPAPAQ
jgi:putative tricarboxylic transport membrane protein